MEWLRDVYRLRSIEEGVKIASLSFPVKSSSFFFQRKVMGGPRFARTASTESEEKKKEKKDPKSDTFVLTLVDFKSS